MAAAHAAIGAAQLVRARPSASPRQLRVALTQGADPRLPARGAGAGLVRVPAREAAIVARTRPAGSGDPCPRRTGCVRIELSNQGAAPARLALALDPDPGTEARLGAPGVRIPPGGAREAEIDIGAGAAGVASGRLVARDQAGATVVSQPFALPTEPPAPVPAGPLALERRRGRVTGVHFPLGAFERGDPLRGGSALSLTERLDLALVRARGNRLVAAADAARRRARAAPGRVRLRAARGHPARPRARPLRLPRARPLAAGGRQADGRPLGRVPAMRTVTLYGRPDCHLCDDARAALLRVRRTHPFRLEERDIEADEALFARYLERIPVVALDGEELFEFFVDEEQLRRKL